MKKIILCSFISLSLLGCSSNHQIQNTKNIQKCIYNDNLTYDYFDSFKDSDTITRLPDGTYIHGTSEVKVNNEIKYYDSDKDTGAIKAKKAKYLCRLYFDARDFIEERFQNYNSEDKIIYNLNGGLTESNDSYIENMDTGEITLISNTNVIQTTVKEEKQKELKNYLKKSQKALKRTKNNPLDKSERLSTLLPTVKYESRLIEDSQRLCSINYYGISQKEYSKYLKSFEDSGFDIVIGMTCFRKSTDSSLFVNTVYYPNTKILSVRV